MRRTRLRDHSINRLIPNMLTLFALCAGLTSIKFALDANALMNVTLSTDQSAVADAAARKWELAAIAIIVAAVFDALDGRIARLLDSTSKFGAELDSLSDFVAFGVAPSVVLYVWTMDQTGRIGWGCALLFSACMARRLVDPVLEQLATAAQQRSLTANQVTVAGFVCGLAAIAAIALQSYGLGLLLLLGNRLADGVDGALAKRNGPTDLGGYLDIVLDFIIYAGAAFAFALAQPEHAVAAAFLIFSFMGTGSSFLAFAIFAAKRKLDGEAAE